MELYGFEACPYCRKVREALCNLNLDYLVHNVAKKSPRRPQLVERGGRMMVPYLIDPNTGTEMYESDDIVLYLGRVYGSWLSERAALPPPSGLRPAPSPLRGEGWGGGLLAISQTGCS